MNKIRKIIRPFMYAILIFYALITLYPFLWAVSASFKSLAEITGGGLGLIPKQFTLNNFVELFSSSANYPRWFLNSVYVGVIGTFLNVILNSMAGYALAQITFKGSKAIFYIMIAAMTIPGQLLLIPNYLIVKVLGLMGSYSSILIPGAINLSYIFLMRQYFMNYSKQVEEAAKMDGLSRIGSFFRIAMPLAKPVLATQATFVFLGFWNDFTRVMLYIKDVKMYTLPLGIQASQSKYAGYTMWNEIMASSVVSMVPILIMYIVLNKYFLKGVRMDAEK